MRATEQGQKARANMREADREVTVTTSEPVPYNRFPELAPSTWFSDGDGEPAVWLRAYLTGGIPMDPQKRSMSMELPGEDKVLVHIRHGAFSAPPEIKLVPAGGGRFAGHIGAQRQYPDDVYLVLMAPIDDKFQGEAKAKRLLDSVGGLMAATVSPNMIMLPLFEHGELVREPKSFVPSAPIRPPGTYRAPDLGHERLARAAIAIADAPDSLRNRVTLSTRWLHAGLLEELGVDAFVKLWVAIEALTMTSDKTKPLVELLASKYCNDEGWVRSKLKIDRLAQVRGDILHNGKMPTIRGDVLRFMVALYEDALAARLDLQFERRAEPFIDCEVLKFL